MKISQFHMIYILLDEKEKNYKYRQTITGIKIIKWSKRSRNAICIAMIKDDQRTISLIIVIQVKAPKPERCIASTNLATSKNNNK